MKPAATLAAALALSLAWGCARSHPHASAAAERTATSAAATVLLPAAAEAGPTPWTHLRFDNDPDQFQFAIVADRTGAARPGVFESAIPRLNLLKPEFVMCVGDLIEGYTEDEPQIDREWDEIDGFLEKLEAPFFRVAGNHDLSNDTQKGKWRDRFGPSYYYFVYRGVLFLCLNTEDPAARIGPEQIAYFERALKQNDKVRWTCLFMHQPLWTSTRSNGWTEIEKLLGDRQYTVFAGHHHAYTKYVRNDRRYIVLATTGGGFKDGLTSPETGTFDHVTWVTMTEQGPRLANLALGGIYDEDVRTEETANLLGRILRSGAMQISPALVRGDTFDGATLELTLNNDAELPMTASGVFGEHDRVRAVPGKFEVTVPPKSSQKLTVRLQLDGPAKVDDLAPLSLNWAGTYERPGHPPLRVDRAESIAVERVRASAPRTAPVVVDGKLDEWGELPIVVNKPADAEKARTWSGPQDNAYRFAVARDDAHVYVAIRTTDDHFVLNPKKTPWSQDGIEVRLDARADPKRSIGRGQREFRDVLVVSMSADPATGKAVLYEADQLPSGVQAACVKSDTGYAAEIAIPASHLDEKQGGPWKAFRLNVAVNDYDDVAGPLEAMWWRPDWRSPKTFSGSGTFERQ